MGPASDAPRGSGTRWLDATGDAAASTARLATGSGARGELDAACYAATDQPAAATATTGAATATTGAATAVPAVELVRIRIGDPQRVRLNGENQVSLKVDRRLPVLVCVALGAVAVGASGGTSSGGAPGEGSSSHPATADVTITKCALAKNPFEGPKATVKASDYIVTIAFDSPDGSKQLDTGDASVDNLGSGQQSTTGAVSLKSGLRKKKFVCKVADVTRISAEG
jgi:hypothetical protein